MGGQTPPPSPSPPLPKIYYTNFVTFPKIYLVKFCEKFFFSYFSQLLLMSLFFNKGNSCEIENSIYYDAIVKMVYFVEYFFILQNNLVF